MTSLDDTLSRYVHTHGTFSEAALLAQKLKQIIRAYDRAAHHTGGGPDDIQIEALDLIATKIAHITLGDLPDRGHWRAIAVYAELVARELDSQSWRGGLDEVEPSQGSQS